MTRLSSVAFLAALMVMVLAGTILAQPTKPAQPAQTTPAKLAAVARAEAEIGVLPTQTRVEKEFVITTIKVKNLMTANSIAGLKVEEYWWDKANNPVTGSKAKLAKPLQPGEEATLTLTTPKDPKMFRNNYVFTHANGKIKTKSMKAF